MLHYFNRKKTQKTYGAFSKNQFNDASITLHYRFNILTTQLHIILEDNLPQATKPHIMCEQMDIYISSYLYLTYFQTICVFSHCERTHIDWTNEVQSLNSFSNSNTICLCVVERVINIYTENTFMLQYDTVFL